MRFVYASLAIITLAFVASGQEEFGRLRHALPYFSFDDVFDCSATHAKRSSYSSCCYPAGAEISYLDNLLLSQNGSAVAFSGSTPSLGSSVGSIVPVCSKKQVGWANTNRVVAPMEDLKFTCDGSDEQDVTGPMGSAVWICFRSFDYSISVLICFSDPRFFRSTVYIRSSSFCQRI